MTAAPERILVIGAGVIGLNCALALRKTGAAVTVIDERGPGEGTSFGNAGCIAIAEILPSVTRAGAQPSIPTLHDVQGFVPL